MAGPGDAGSSRRFGEVNQGGYDTRSVGGFRVGATSQPPLVPAMARPEVLGRSFRTRLTASLVGNSVAFHGASSALVEPLGGLAESLVLVCRVGDDGGADPPYFAAYGVRAVDGGEDLVMVVLQGVDRDGWVLGAGGAP